MFFSIRSTAPLWVTRAIQFQIPDALTVEREVNGALGRALCEFGLDNFEWNHKHFDRIGRCEQFYDFRKLHKLPRNQKQLR